jgi:hypothetical protein
MNGKNDTPHVSDKENIVVHCVHHVQLMMSCVIMMLDTH